MKVVTKWTVPEGGGAPLLTMPNIPKPLQGNLCQPRTIVGKTEWDKMRKECYELAGDICEACGQKLCGRTKGEYPLHHAHELFSYDFDNCTATFERVVCLCPACHVGFLHSGRAITMYLNHNFYYTKEFMLENLERAFKLIHQWNVTHSDQEPLRIWATILRWADEPSLAEGVNRLIKEYDIHFYTAANAMGENNTWSKWKLIYDGTEYYTPYEDDSAWQRAMDEKNGIETASLFEGDVFEELRKNIKGTE